MNTAQTSTLLSTQKPNGSFNDMYTVYRYLQLQLHFTDILTVTGNKQESLNSWETVHYNFQVSKYHRIPLGRK